MCGIWGIAYGSKREEWTPTELAQLTFPEIGHRGPHSFGWMTWDGTGEVQVAKHIGDVRRVSELEKVQLDDNAKWVIGHVRYATNGTPEYEGNNHPLQHGDIGGVHNGRIHNFEHILDITGRTDPNAEVDSEAIFAAVDRWGHRAGLRRIQGNLTTAYTRLSRPRSIYIARSTERYTLWLARTAAGNLVFASELGILRAVFGRKLTHVRQLKPYQLLRVADGRIAETGQYQAPPPPPIPAPKVRVQGGSWSSGSLIENHRRKWDAHRWAGSGRPTLDPKLAHPESSTPITDEFMARLNDRLARQLKLDGKGNVSSNGKGKRKGKGKRGKIKVTMRPQGYRDGDEVRPGVFYYNGLLMGEDEYVNAIADEVGWE